MEQYLIPSRREGEEAKIGPDPKGKNEDLDPVFVGCHDQRINDRILRSSVRDDSASLVSVSSLGESFVLGVEDLMPRSILVDGESTICDPKEALAAPIKPSRSPTEKERTQKTLRFDHSTHNQKKTCETEGTMEQPLNPCLNSGTTKEHYEPGPIPAWIKAITLASLLLFCLAAMLTALALVLRAKDRQSASNGDEVERYEAAKSPVGKKFVSPMAAPSLAPTRTLSPPPSVRPSTRRPSLPPKRQMGKTKARNRLVGSVYQN